MRTLLEFFQDTKETLCRYDYYIHTQKRILHLTNSEIKIPHLMGMQYLGKPNQFTGDFGAYAIKKQRVTMESVEKLVRKYYKTEEKQRRMPEMIYRKLDNLGELGEENPAFGACQIRVWRRGRIRTAITASKPKTV